MTPRTPRPRPLFIDVLAALVCLAIAWWRTSSLENQPMPFGLVLVSVAAALYGVGIGWWARSGRRRSFLVVGLLVVVVVFVLLVGAPPRLAGTRWAWLLTSFAGGIIGSGIREWVVARASAVDPKRGRRRPGGR